MKKLPDFKIQSNGEISSAFLDREIHTFHKATEFIEHLTYGRNSNKDDLKTLFTDNKGTCSTKHAVLKRLTDEHNFTDIKLMLGIFKMNAENLPVVVHTLSGHHLKYLPEAHNYLKYKGQIFDFTKPHFLPQDFAKDILYEVEIKPNEINQHKINIHKQFIKTWLQENKQINFSLEEIWKIREQCIEDLSM